MFDIVRAARELDSQLPAQLRDLEQLVNIDSGTFDKAGVDHVSTLLRDRYEALGGSVRIYPDTVYGDTFSATFEGSGSGNVLLLGHLDTVYPLGTAESRPFRIEGDRAYGPGVADMKSGDVAILYALRTVLAQPSTFQRVTVLHNADEEIGSPTSRGLVRHEAERADAALVLEPGRENGNVVSARKGVADCRLTVQGVAAHAGVNHEMGRSAILELAHLLVGLESLNGTIDGATLNVGHVTAGERINVVPAEAFAHFELRAVTRQSLDELVQRVRETVKTRTVQGTTAELTIEIHHSPMARTPDSERLVRLAQRQSSILGFDLEDTATGGASDGNTAASAGCPVLDGLGPVGGGAHTPEEYIDVRSVVPRTALLAGLIAAAGSGQW